MAAFLRLRSEAVRGTTSRKSLNARQDRAEIRKPHHGALRRGNKDLKTASARNAIPATPARFMCRF